MNEKPPRTDQHDFVKPDELQVEDEKKQAMMEAKYSGELNHFRMEVASLLGKHGALDNGVGLAVFQQEVFEPDQPPSILQTLVYVCRNEEAPDVAYSRPSIRIITNELIKAPLNKKWMVVDFTADEEDDAQYFIDMFDMQRPNYPPEEAIMDVHHATMKRDTAPLAPLFYLSDDEFSLTPNYRHFTPTAVIPIETNEADNEGETKNEYVMPFGNYKYDEDKFHALSIGQELFSQVSGLDPIFVTTMRA